MIEFFGYLRLTVYEIVAKYKAYEKFGEGSANLPEKSDSKESETRTPAVVEKAQACVQ